MKTYPVYVHAAVVCAGLGLLYHVIALILERYEATKLTSTGLYFLGRQCNGVGLIALGYYIAALVHAIRGAP